MAPKEAASEHASPLLSAEKHTEVAEGAAHEGEAYIEYSVRWWELFHFSLFCCLQGWCWAIPGTVTTTYQVGGVAAGAVCRRVGGALRVWGSRLLF